MKIIYSKILPPKGFSAINLFGFLIIRHEYKELFEKNPFFRNKLLNHETIHTKQMQEMLYIFFYLWYGIEWLIRWVSCGLKSKKAYRSILFEKEAYKYENDLQYLQRRKSFSWLRY